MTWSRFRRTTVPAILIVLSCGVPCFGQSPKPPSELDFLSTWGEVHPRYAYEVWGQSTFPQYGATQVDKRGRHWTFWQDIPGQKDRVAAWDVVKPVALKAGWTVVSVNPNGGFLALLRYNQNGVDAWLNAVLDQTTPTTVRLVLDLVEVSPRPISLTLKEPAATPEPLPAAGKGDSHFLHPFPVLPRVADRNCQVPSS